MPAHSSDEVAPTVERLEHLPEESPVRRDRSRRRSRRTDWRLGGRTVRRWREWVLAVALGGLGMGVLAATAVTVLWPGMSSAATVLLWAGMVGPVVFAFTRSRPAGLLRVRAIDVLFGLTLGVMLRLVQGWLEAASGGGADFPAFERIGGRLPDGWVFADVVAPVIIAPAVEEFFFRAVVLVALYTVLRRPCGAVVAGVAAVLFSSGLFVLVHGLIGDLALDQVVSVGLLGLVCGTLVLLTGRIWAAILTHAAFNGAWVALALVGTALS
ncbi:CPBP family intramembrane glutamic endopeptidase [Microbacterium sp. SSW1-59]|uniref:CPBP family intramembrane glutamic endopeptidase n=1 Tax=Microbacterium xanthum TaxID=3079794 RepID=UPI002AD2BB54|nr:CPBP family intramembrane glutamic endopeptidase [Microbacterium sp. SSW1-59]MDZ8201345.1 CPBP family intramembrane glutamic endopeptidase [Microbacterium sp. SSW1-59]